MRARGIDYIDKGDTMTTAPESVKVYAEHEQPNGDIRRVMIGLMPIRDASPVHISEIVKRLTTVWVNAVNGEEA